MQLSLLLALPLLASPLSAAPGLGSALAGATPVPARIQDVPDKREDVQQLVTSLGEHLKKRGKEDAEAVQVIGQLHELFPDCGPKDRESIAKAIGKVLGEKRKVDEDGSYDNELFRPAANALGDMAPESVKLLVKAIEGKAQRENLDLQRHMILALGRTKDEAATELLADLLKNKDAIVQGAAAEALGQFRHLDLKRRKELFSEMLKVLMSVKSRMDNDSNDTEALHRYGVIEVPIVTSLKALSGQDLSVPEEWERWWNKNKKEDWDA